MAERKLNFNAPLLSTRRMQKTAISKRRNKSNNFIDDYKTNDCSSVLVQEMGLEQVTEPASVPFTWEQAPGRSKSIDFGACDLTHEVFTPCLPPGKANDGNLTRFQTLKGKQVEESEGEDDVFSDARDTLSPMDSYSMNNSISDVSGYGVVETKKLSKLSEDDSQSRDFMLNRFLPAAKAMTLEQSRYALNRKPSSFMSEPTMQIRGLVPEEKRQTPNRYDESIVSSYYYHQEIDDEDSEEEEEDDEVSEYAYLSKKGCGMLQQLCFKDSLSMLNTMPGFKAKPISPRSLGHDQVKSSKVAQLKSRFQSAKKLALDSVSKHKLGGKVQSPIHPSTPKNFNSESNLTSTGTRASSPCRHTRCISPFRNTSTSSTFHPTGFPETRKQTENLRANRLNKHIRNSSLSQELLCPKSYGSTSSFLKKTVYVDTETNDEHKGMVFSEEVDMVGKKPDPDRSLIAPPSPKKPSESWLLHNLPSVTSQIPSHRYPPGKQGHKENSRDVTKWETIVKTSYAHKDHIRYSEELVAHKSL